MLTLNRRTALGFCAAAPLLARADLSHALIPDAGRKLAAAARAQIGVTVTYDASYRSIGYPNGDVLRTSGVCSDVLIRAARDAWDIDLQQRVHEDMKAAFDAYPSRREWGLTSPDANIDHRRVLNLEAFLARQKARLPLPAPRLLGGDAFDAVAPGDILTWRLAGGRPHLGIAVSGPEQVRVAHNVGDGVREEPLWRFKLHKPAGHYRWRV
ncbi:DUF1287 domain-containing protein [Caulobacter vibrioides]|uniref:DUF1287 domain-containing protein n=2 Tax=Caulobacter vibrioides TaxID=155892 RepID=Q9A8H4_CAUVC|nr:DUF1287 domain-containing protein [Caulobacter vibrioides]YP_002516816.1 YiijF-family protein [Caulobacter vibrioides NA1000]AAK23360.1 conserved hypothetical protein [Caulobacter vibrioides CB15]ACL94908.1 YiijF-family protein [Caulobacter vibrioides NA1000]ATC28191.1 DUF1287 domain-containing protein [Caulobacter vibrioides]QXZ53457.1 DUF1287 domain-containing protein [Caulobacter vibrioides]